ncbi:nitrogen fixation protein NifQ [Methylocapsa acidiphila]|uniref:nitrogen fixation protein NifQ n=1 Tax=Methylocapsa acidiphila TaxID=133552 RepID=UPI000425E0C7|nr:nitrogen fixation protein NifQ [Methylocapsa acidiphila]
MRVIEATDRGSGGGMSTGGASQGAALTGESFDRHVLGRVFLLSASEADRLGDPVSDRLGLETDELQALADYLGVVGLSADAASRNAAPEDEETMVRTLLRQNCSKANPIGSWLSGIIARRSLESNHLWEDLGLAKRTDLSTLLLRHFPGLAEKNTRNMRWKKFLYRALCEAEGFSMCPSPTCDACAEFHICFSDESGPSALARANRDANAG